MVYYMSNFINIDLMLCMVKLNILYEYFIVLCAQHLLLNFRY